MPSLTTLAVIGPSGAITLAIIGIAVGLALLVRGLAGYRRASLISDIAGATISAIAVGENRVSGTIEAAELTLISPLQSEPCVYYRASVTEEDGRSESRVFHDERAVGFRVRDPSGTLRVFPRGRHLRRARPVRRPERHPGRRAGRPAPAQTVRRPTWPRRIGRPRSPTC